MHNRHRFSYELFMSCDIKRNMDTETVLDIIHPVLVDVCLDFNVNVSHSALNARPGSSRCQ